MQVVVHRQHGRQLPRQLPTGQRLQGGQLGQADHAPEIGRVAAAGFQRLADVGHVLRLKAAPARCAGVGQQLGGQAVERGVEPVGRTGRARQRLGLPVVQGHPLHRLRGGAGLAGHQLQPVQALVGRAQQAFALQRGADRHQRLQQSDGGLDIGTPLREALCLVGAFFGRPARRVHPFPGQPGQQVGQLFAAFDRGAAVVGGHRTAVPAHRVVQVACGGAGHAKGFGHRAHAAPVHLEARLQVADLFALQRVGRALRGAFHRQGFQRQRQRHRRRNARVVGAHRFGHAVGVALVGLPHPFRVAVALVSSPGVAQRVGLPGGHAGGVYRVHETVAAQQGLVEGGGKAVGGLVLHRPAGGHHAAHADADQLLGHARREGRAVVALQQLARVGRQVAAVEEHQLGHHAHGLHFARAEEGAVAEHHPTHLGRLAVFDEFGFTVPGDVHDAVGLFQQGVDDRGGVRPGQTVFGDQGVHTFSAQSGGPHQRLGHRQGFAARGGQGWVEPGVAQGLADHQHRVFGARVADLCAELHRAQLAQQPVSNRPGFARFAAAITGSVQQLPGDTGGAVVEFEQQFAAAAQAGFHLHRHQQLEQGAADLRVAVGVVGRAAHQLAHQPRLRGLHPRFGAGALRVQRVGDGRFAGFVFLGNGADEVVPGAAVTAFQRAAQRADAGQHRGCELELLGCRLRQQLQRSPGLCGAVQVELDQVQVGHGRPAAGFELFIGLAHALRQRVGRAAHVHADAAAADEGGRQFKGALVLARDFGHTLRPSQRGLPHSVYQVGAAQLAFLTQPDHHHVGRAGQGQGAVRVLPVVDEELVRARRLGVQAQGQRGAHGTADETVHHRFGAGERGRAVVAHHQRLADELEIAVVHAQTQRCAGAAGGGGRWFVRVQAEHVHQVDWRAQTRGAFARRAAAHQRRGRGCAARGGQGLEAFGIAQAEQVAVGLESVLGVGQVAVFAVQRPGLHAGQQGAVAGHAAVAVVGRVQVEQAFAGVEFKTGGREARPTHHQQQTVGKGLQRLVALGVQPAAQGHGLVQHRLGGHAPAVHAALHLAVVPAVGVVEQLRVLIGQRPPALAAVQAQVRVQQAGLQLDEAGHVGHELARLPVAKRQAKGRQRVAKTVVARKHLHGRERAAVGRAQHQQARAAALQPALPHLRLFQLHRARHQPAHGMRQQVHRLAGGVACAQGLVQNAGQAPRLLFDGAAPVEGKLDHLVCGRQKFGQVVVAAAHGAVGLHVVRVRAPGQPVQPAEDAQAQPHALAVHRQVAAQDAGDQDHRGALGRWSGVARARDAAQSVGRTAGPRHGTDGAVARRLLLRQAVAHRFGGARVAEVGEVGDAAALVEHEAGRRVPAGRRPRRAAVHGPGLHHQVVVGPVEGVGQQGLDPGHDRIALDVAGDHAQLAGQGGVGAVQPLHQRAVGRHGFEAGQQRRVGALAGHRADEVQQSRRHRDGRQLQRPLEHRHISVQPLGGEQGAARRASHAHHALHADVAAPHRVGQVAQRLVLVFVSRVFEGAQLGGVQVGLGADPGQHLGHQTAARMGEQVHAGAVGQLAGQQQRVLDRAGHQRGVVQAVDAVAVVGEQFAHLLRMLLPELAEGAVRFGEGAVQQHQHGRARCGGRDAVELLAAALERRVQPLGAQRVHARVHLAVKAFAELAGRELGRRFGEQAGDDFDAGEQCLPQPAA